MSPIFANGLQPEQCVTPGIEALVFDCDGTLVNSMVWFWECWAKLVAKYNLTFTQERFYQLAGTPVRCIVEIILEESGRDIDQGWIDEFLKEKFALCKARRAANEFPEEIKCVTDIVKAYHGKIPLAVASSGNKEHVLADLHSNNLLKYFDTVVTVEDVANGKPAPDLFLEAARRLGVAPEKCAGYEDADLGIQSLQRAGFQVIVDVRKLHGHPQCSEAQMQVSRACTCR
jgi:HAD superfamily hydrolase (TIGR01509 family)